MKIEKRLRNPKLLKTSHDRALICLLLASKGCVIGHSNPLLRDSESSVSRDATDETIPDTVIIPLEDTMETQTADAGDAISEDTNNIEDSNIQDSADVVSEMAEDASTDSGSVSVRCGMGLSLGYPMSEGVSASPTSHVAEIATASSTPDGSTVAEINWGDSPSYERASFAMSGGSVRALLNHSYVSTGPRTITWRLNGTECGRQAFDVIINRCTGSTASSTSIRVGEAVSLRLFNTSANPSDTYTWGNLPRAANMQSTVGISTITMTAEMPGTFPISGRVVKPSGQYFECPRPTLTVNP